MSVISHCIISQILSDIINSIQTNKDNTKQRKQNSKQHPTPPYQQLPHHANDRMKKYEQIICNSIQYYQNTHQIYNE